MKNSQPLRKTIGRSKTKTGIPKQDEKLGTFGEDWGWCSWGEMPLKKEKKGTEQKQRK